MKPEIIRLNLLSPLLYCAAPEPWSPSEDTGGERLLSFELEPALAQNFLPDREQFPGTLVFSGRAINAETQQAPGTAITELPKGDYLFTQVKERLARGEIIDLAIEVQNEGLWQRLVLSCQYYVRFLSEDGHEVTQIFRPFC